MYDFGNLLAAELGAGLLWLLATVTAKATLLLACAALMCVAFRRFSAAARHLLWATALCATLLLPFLSGLQVLEVPILPAGFSQSETQSASASIDKDEATGPRAAERSSVFNHRTATRVEKDTSPEALTPIEALAPAASLSRPLPFAYHFPPTPVREAVSTPRLSLATPVLLAVWAVGVLLLCFRLLFGLASINSLARRATEFDDPALNGLFASLLTETNLKGSVRLLCSHHTSMPIVCGILRPTVLLPAEAEGWSAERQRMVLLHELTHIIRRDCLTQMLAQAACAFYWFNPLVWAAARRLRVEREKACDDYVLSIGTVPSEYAHHLLEIARTMQERALFKWSQTASVAMARRSQLEGRLLAILNQNQKHGAVPRAARVGLVALMCALLISLGALRPTVSNALGPATPRISDGAQGFGLSHNMTARGPEGGSDAQAVDGKPPTASDTEAEARDAEPSQPDVQDDESPAPEAGPWPGQLAGLDVEDFVRGAALPNSRPPEFIPPPGPELSPFLKTAHGPSRLSQEGRGDFVDEMAAAGYANLSIDELIKLKNAGVTAELVEGLSALGFNKLTVSELASFGVHDVTPAYIRAIRAAGYENLSAKEIISFAIHDITPEFIKSLRDAGYGNLPARQLVEFGIHEVTPAFISAMRAAGYSNLAARDLVSLRVHNVTPEFIRQARSRLGELSLRQLISLKISGVMEDDDEKDK